MKTLPVPKWFGIAPILMLGYDGRLRIIYPDGKVEYSDYFDTYRETNFATGKCTPVHPFMSGCTSRDSQKEAYEAAVRRDAAYAGDAETNLSAFLGYL